MVFPVTELRNEFAMLRLHQPTNRIPDCSYRIRNRFMTFPHALRIYAFPQDEAVHTNQTNPPPQFSGITRTLRLLLQSPRSPLQPPLFQSLQLAVYFFPLKWYLIGTLRLRPEIIDRKAVFEVGAEVVHPGDGEHDVHSKLVFRN